MRSGSFGAWVVSSTESEKTEKEWVWEEAVFQIIEYYAAVKMTFRT